MARLRVYSGPEASNRVSRLTGIDGVNVLSFNAFVSRNRPVAAARTPLTRAKALHRNRRCRFCGHGGIDPVTLNDGVRDGSGRYVPGSATLVGFHCEACHAEWPVLED